MPRRVAKPAVSKPAPNQLSLPMAMLVTGSLSLVLALSWLVLTGIAALHLSFSKLNEVAQAAQTTPSALISQGISGWLATPTQTNNKKNFLILGTDTLATRGDAAPLTDTILLLSLDLKTGQIRTLPIPRDTYSETYQSRLNAIYALGIEEGLSQPASLMTQEIETLTQIPIHHTVLLSLEEVAQVIDLVGGVTVDVPEGFIDTQFPRTDVDVTVERNPARLYQTVEFTPGTELMSGERALQYIRSRHAAGAQGSDDARSVRQQLVIESLMRQLIAQPPTDNIALYGKLYAYYQQHFAQYVSLTELIATAKVLYPIKDQVTFQGNSLSIYPTDPVGVLFHPPENTTNGMWLYKIRDPETFEAEVRSKLQL